MREGAVHDALPQAGAVRRLNRGVWLSDIGERNKGLGLEAGDGRADSEAGASCGLEA
jgi:hypothetical protein